MKIKILIVWGLCLMNNRAYSSFPADDSVTPIAKPVRNTIFSSVQKNPLSGNTSITPSLDTTSIKPTPISLPKPLITSAPVVSQPKEPSKTVLPLRASGPLVLEPEQAISKEVTSQELPKLSDVVAKTSKQAVPEQATAEQVIPETVDESSLTPKSADLLAKALPHPDVVTADAAKAKEINHDDADHKSAAKPEEHDEAKSVEHKEPGVLYQAHGLVDDDPATIAFNFEDASLANLISYMEAVHSIKFISEDIIPTAKDIKGVSGHKITFRTNRNLTRKESWDLCLTFLHIAGLDVVPMIQQGFYRIVPLTKANNEPIPTYIGVDVDLLPDSDMIVRYVYFARNVDPAKVQPILSKMQSGSAKLDVYAELKGLIFTDRANSIKSLMKIVTELDRAALPEVLSVVKLQRANADDVIKLYDSLKPSGAAGAQPQRAWVANKKEASIDYFPQDVVMVADKRTNSLILLGTAKDVQRIEEFITKHVDIAIERGAPPLFTYRLQYTNAKDIADLLNKIVSYGAKTTAGQYGGVRDGIKYFQSMSIIPDTWTNSLVINATPEDYEALKPLIAELDVAQKQIGLEVLIVQVTDSDTKTLGSQISGPNGQGSAVAGASLFGPTFAQSVTAQTSGLGGTSPIVVTRGTAGVSEDFSIKSSLAQLLGNTLVNQAGILVTFGKPIWAIFQILKSITSTHVIANPFVVVSNNSSAVISSGEERRQISGEVISSSSVKATGLTPIQAKLSVTITPQINKGNMINLTIDVTNSQFTATLGGNNDPRNEKEVQTVATIANGETLVLGGIMIENYSSASNGVPFLEHIPIFGWFFKSKSRVVKRDHFLIFVCPRMLDPVGDSTDVDAYTNYKLHEAQKHIDLIDESDWFSSGKDPLEKAFFGSKGSSRVLQELRTGKNFAQRVAVDGKINTQTKITLRKEKLAQQKKVKQARKDAVNNRKLRQEQLREQRVDQEQVRPIKMSQSKKNSITNSIQSAQGVSHVA